MRALSLAILFGAAAAGAQVLAPSAPPTFVPRERSRVRRVVPSAPEPRYRATEHPAAAINLQRALDALRDAGPVSIGGAPYKFGVAADRDFKYFFTVLTREGVARLLPISRPRDLAHGGVVLDVEGKPFRVRIAPRWRYPVRGSELSVAPEGGSADQKTVWSTGELLELLKRKATFLRVEGEEFHVAYLSDIDPATGQPAGTRSFLFFRESRFRARAWTLAEQDLPEGTRMVIALGERLLLLERRRELLLIFPVARP